MSIYIALLSRKSNALNTLVSGEKPGFQALFKSLCAEVVQQGVTDQEHSECSASNSG